MCILYLTVHLDDILFLMLIAWMHEIVREASIIGEDDESSRLLIEAPDRKYALRHVHDIHDPLLIIFTRQTSRDDTAWLMEYIVHEILLIFDDSIIDFYDIFFWVDDLSDMRDDIIHTDESTLDILLSLTT